MEDKLHKLDYEVQSLKRSHEDAEKHFTEFQNSVKSSLINIDTSMSRMADMFTELTKLNHRFDMLEKETTHKESLMHGKLKGIEELTRKDIDNLADNFDNMTKSLKTMTWTMVTAIGAVFGTVLLKQIGLM